MTNPNTDNEKAGGVNLFLTKAEAAHILMLLKTDVENVRFLCTGGEESRDLLKVINSQIGGQS